MKLAKRRRDPSREPLASPYSDEERRALDGVALQRELERAVRKSQSAQEQMKRGESLPFLDPQESDMSAGKTALYATEVINKKIIVVDKLRAGQRMAGRDRARVLKKNAEENYENIHRLATNLLLTNVPREIVRLIVEGGYTETTVRRALRTHPSRRWKRKPGKGAAN